MDYLKEGSRWSQRSVNLESIERIPIKFLQMTHAIYRAASEFPSLQISLTNEARNFF